MPPRIPFPTIYLRNKFSVRPGLSGRFFTGQRELLKQTRRSFEFTEDPSDDEKSIRLVAGCGERALIEGKPVPEKLPQMMHIWRLPQWDSLYQLMYTFSETDWYADEVSSLQVEHQDLLVGIGAGIEIDRRPEAWRSAENPNYVYLYDEIRLNPLTSKLKHLRELNWFASCVREKGWSLIWVATEVTGTPSQVCLLWCVRNVALIESTLQYMTYDPEVANRFAAMMTGIESLSRQYMYPESTEHIDNGL